MVRAQVYLGEAQVRRLASATGKSQSQLVRDAVDQLDLPEETGGTTSFLEAATDSSRQLEKSAVLARIAGAWASSDTDFSALRRERDNPLDSE